MARKSWAWTGVSLIVALVLPPVHSFSALIAALTVTAVVVALVDARQDRRSATIGGVLLIVVWGSILGYYRLVQSIPELTLVYTDRLLSAPGVFVAWVILLVVGVVALAGSSGLTQRVVVGVLLLGQFVLFVVNAVQPVFPGTQPSTQIVLISAFPLVGIATLATWALPIGASRQHDGAVAAAIVAGPLVMILYALTAGLTPEYYSIVLRAQTFEHVGVLVLGGVGTVMVADAVQSRLTGHYPAGSSVVRLAVVIIVLLSVAASAPLAVATLDTGEIPTTTTPAEFAATGTAAERLPSPWASDHPFSRLGTFHGADTTTAPVRSWIRSGVPPTCPTVYRPSWVSHGANLFPASAGRLSAGSFSSWQGRNDHVYRAVGVDDAGIVVSPAGPKSC